MSLYEDIERTLNPPGPPIISDIYITNITFGQPSPKIIISNEI